jgi:hypothetical protein
VEGIEDRAPAGSHGLRDTKSQCAPARRRPRERAALMWMHYSLVLATDQVSLSIIFQHCTTIDIMMNRSSDSSLQQGESRPGLLAKRTGLGHWILPTHGSHTNPMLQYSSLLSMEKRKEKKEKQSKLHGICINHIRAYWRYLTTQSRTKLFIRVVLCLLHHHLI